MNVICQRTVAAGLLACGTIAGVSAQSPELVVAACAGSTHQEVAAVCGLNARWDEANLKMDAAIVEPILDEQFVWVTGGSCGRRRTSSRSCEPPT